MLPPEGSDTGSTPVSNTKKKWVISVKNLGIYLTISVIFVFGIFFTIYGIEYNKRESDFKKKAGEVTATIYQNTISNHKQVLYINLSIEYFRKAS